jgi:retron-type reverse transcriptase
MGSVASIGVSLSDIWCAWNAFNRGKKKTIELDTFVYSLEQNLNDLHKDMVADIYTHGPYRSFILTDTKKRNISVASIRDRVIHRLIYDYLVSIFDKTFIYDAWSCRAGKGLLGAIERTQYLLHRYHTAYVWRSDITKFFDSVDQETLKNAIKRKVNNLQTLHLIDTVRESYSSYKQGKGMPIGNLTSQIFYQYLS